MNNITCSQDGSALPGFIVSAAGNYSLVAANHCGEGFHTIHIDYISPPSGFNLGRDTLLCPGQSLILCAPVTNADLFWHLEISDTGTYSLTVSAPCKDDLHIAWNGQYRNRDLDPGVYVCRFQVSYHRGVEIITESITRDLTLIR